MTGVRTETLYKQNSSALFSCYFINNKNRHNLEGIKLQELKYSFYIICFKSAQLIAINVPLIF